MGSQRVWQNPPSFQSQFPSHRVVHPPVNGSRQISPSVNHPSGQSSRPTTVPIPMFDVSAQQTGPTP